MVYTKLRFTHGTTYQENFPAMSSSLAFTRLPFTLGRIFNRSATSRYLWAIARGSDSSQPPRLQRFDMSLCLITNADIRQPTTSACFSLLLRSQLARQVTRAGKGVGRGPISQRSHHDILVGPFTADGSVILWCAARPCDTVVATLSQS